MLRYETVNIWNCIQKDIEEWIDSIIVEGWNIYREKKILEDISEELCKIIVKSLIKDIGVSESEILRLLDKFYPAIYVWIDEILLNKSDFIRKNGKVKEFSIKLTKCIIRLFLEEEDITEFI